MPRLRRTLVATLGSTVVALALVLALSAGAGSPAGASNGGGAGTSGSSIWAATWWDGSPQGPGPYEPGQSGSAGVCSWTDVGGSVGDLVGALAGADLPASFWPVDGSGYTPGSRAVERWALRLTKGAPPPAHFDIVDCPSPGLVPAPSGEMYTAIPTAEPPGGPQYIWAFWDTVPDPAPGDFPPVIGEALRNADLPSPAIHTSPSSVEGITDATIVNFPTWFWIDPSAWRTITATATGGGLVATVWAFPQFVSWRAHWDYQSATSNPQQGVDLQQTDLDLICDGPGDAYSSAGWPATASSPDCGVTFTQSTFGYWVPLDVAIEWNVYWELTSTAGVVGGEGELPQTTTTATRPLRVTQIESVVSAGP